GEQGIETGAAADYPEGGAVLGCDVVKPVGEHEAAGARHVLRNDGRIAWDEAPHVASQRTGIDIVSAARAVADVEIEALAPVELRRALRRTDRDRGEGEDHGGGRPPPVDNT